MKKFYAVLLTAAMVLSLTACGGNGGNKDQTTSANANNTQESTPAQEESKASAENKRICTDNRTSRSG